MSDDVFADHFPGNPVFPGVLLLEGMAQTAGVLLNLTSGGERVALLVSIERVRFLAFARPGDRVLLTVQVEEIRDATARIVGSATVDDRPIASGRFAFRLFDIHRLVPPHYEPYWHQTIAVWQGKFPSLTDE